eukprot:301695-Pleurochrysis_carterae.AAC.1
MHLGRCCETGATAQKERHRDSGAETASWRQRRGGSGADAADRCCEAVDTTWRQQRRGSGAEAAAQLQRRRCSGADAATQ